jgi:hypothetical protein
MNHRPYCLAGALAVLTWGLVCGNPFRCVGGAGAAAPSDDARNESISPPPLVVTPALAPASATALVPAVLGGAAVDADELPDPDEVGPCPEPGLPPVLRRGRDGDGLETWWHSDGSLTKRSTQRVDGEVVPVTVRVLPARPLGEPEDEPPK